MEWRTCCVALAVILSMPTALLTAQDGQGEDDPKMRSQWAFEPGSWVLVEGTTEIDGKLFLVSHKKITLTKSGLEELYVRGDLNGQTFVVSRRRPYMPGGEAEHDSFQMTIDGKTYKCGVTVREDKISGRSEFPKFIDELQENDVSKDADSVRRRHFQFYRHEDANVPFRQLPIQGADLALPPIMLGVRVEVFSGDTKEPRSVQTLTVETLNEKHHVSGKTLTCVKEVGNGFSHGVDGRKIDIQYERLLSSEVLGHLVVNKKTVTYGTAAYGTTTRVWTDEVLAYFTAAPADE